MTSSERGPAPEGRLGIIAGGGTLPARVAAASVAGGRDVFIVGLQGFAEPASFARHPHEIIRVGAAGRILAALREHGCDRVLMIGKVRRPSILDLRPDPEGVRILARIGRAAFAGDDGFLAAIIRVFREEGFEVIGVQDVLREALAPAGLLTRAGPDSEALADIRRGVSVARALGRADVGQACVVQQGLVLAVEAIEGTDAMLARCKALARPGPGGVMVKIVKPGQERRADLPTLGLATVKAAWGAGLRGIAYEGSGILFPERAVAVAAADESGLFLLGLDPADMQSEG